jgi:hypothetical protein
VPRVAVAAIGVSLVALLTGTTREAFASAGCDAVNAGGFNQTTNVSQGITISNFAIGDRLTFMIATTGTGSWNLDNGAQSQLLAGPLSAGSASYTVTGANGDTSLFSFMSIPAGGSVRVTATCTTAAFGGTDSQKIRAIQTLATKSVAVVSGQVISNAIDGGITDAFSRGGNPVTFGPNGTTLNFTAEPQSDVTRRADTAFAALGYAGAPKRVPALGGSLKGDGESLGGYFARRFDNWRFDAALVWSNMNYQATAGTATGSFLGSRWLASTGLTGTYKLNAFVVQPSAKLDVLWEHQRDWTDSLGTAQAARNFSAGRTALGAQIGRPFATAGGWTFLPYAGLYGDWRFSSDNALPTGTPVANIKDGWSARVTSGAAWSRLGGASISFGGELGGIGSNYKIWSGQLRGTVPF